jgi:prepilin-type processing-associated H-X9-DG protein
VRDALGRHALAANVSFVGGSVLDALRDTDVVLYNTTSVAYEALALGIPVVFVESDFWFDIDPLPPGSDVREAARTPAEIRAAIERLLRETPAEGKCRRLRAQELIGEAFA